eukprot:CAMPEP_0116108190 /NCGR_PEP_ID=MMETSP0327-20121206/16642_1 /TAXON_ID=44447 /ORGANISM="Pseudo-nitzschia delicatissima, Strain B596" /LENGTH=1230 /DNA_ID=CAMNT_0003601063 /DNA_START=55 /DNA_END=3750 /DNA_ORIENTATION=-
MVNAKSNHSLRRQQPIEKLKEGAFSAVSTEPFHSIQESREELYLPFQNHSSIIRGQHNPPVPRWDARASPPNPHDLQLNVPFMDQNLPRNPGETNSRWDQYSEHSGASRHRQNQKSQNIWSSQNPSQNCDSSLYSASTNPSIGSYSLGALNASSQQQSNYVGLQQSYNAGDIRDITASMNRAHLNDKDETKTLASYSSSTVPGVVGASSGSTGGTGGSSFTGQPYRSNNYSAFYNYPQQSMMNSSAQAFYPNQYPQERAPPGFRPYEQPFGSAEIPERNFGYNGMGDGGNSIGFNNSSGGYPKNVRETNRRKNGKRDEWRNRKDRKSNERGPNNYRKNNRSKQQYPRKVEDYEDAYEQVGDASTANSDAIRMMMNPQEDLPTTNASLPSSLDTSALAANRLPLDRFAVDSSQGVGSTKTSVRAILPSMNDIEVESLHDKDVNDNGDVSDDDEEEGSYFWAGESSVDDTTTNSKKKDWLLRMNRRLTEISVGDLDPSTTPISAIMNGWAKTKSSHGASMVEKWLDRAQEEFDAGNTKVVPTNKMFTMAVDAWAKSGEGVSAAQRAESILQHMNKKYQTTGLENLRPTTGIFNAVINAWARSKEKIAPSRAEQILKWMDNLHKTNPSIKPDKYTFNTVIHAYAKSGGVGAAKKAQELLNRMHVMYQQGNDLAKPDTITYNVVINSLAKSGGKDAAREAEKLLAEMHKLYENGDKHVKPNVVTYGAVIDAYAKSGEKHAAARADALLAKMIHLHQMDPSTHSDLSPNTYVFNTVINAHAKSKEHDAASKAEEMLLAMNRLHLQGIPNLKPDAFTYTAVIDAWAKSGYRGAAARADQLLDTMESKYLAGDTGLKPNTFTYNAVINALAKSGEPSAAARAERVLHNMVNRHKHGASDDVKPTTINFNSVLDAWAKSGGGRKAAERAEEILEWMDRLYKSGNTSVRPDTITFNAVLDAWARSGDRMAAHRAEQILDHMDELYRAGNQGVKPDTYTYNTLINAHAKSSEKGSAARAEHVLEVMKQRYLDGDGDFKPNTRTHTSVVDAWAKSGEKGAARRAEQILNNMIASFEETGDFDSKPNVHTANAVCNACAFTKREEDRHDALQIAFRVYDWLESQTDMEPDAYTYTILLSVCSNLLPREDRSSRFSHAKSFFKKCCESGHVNDYVLRKLRQTVSEQEYLTLVDYQGAGALPASWTRKIGHRNKRFTNSSGGGNGMRNKNSTRSNRSKRRGCSN